MKHVKVSFDPLRKMDAATRKIITIMRDYAALRDVIRQDYQDRGTFGCAAMTAELDRIYKTARAKTAPFRWEMEAAYKDFVRALDDAVLPNGSSIDAGDAALLQNNLVRTTTELHALQRRYDGNRAMLRMIEDYAARHKWEGFQESSYDDARYLREFAEDRLNMAREVADHFEGQAVSYNAAYFEKHIDAGQDFKDWAGDRISFS